MKVRFPFQLQFFLSVLAALLIGWLISTPQIIGSKGLPAPSLIVTPKPFKNLSGVWMIRVRLSRFDAPKIEEVKILDEGRITPTQGGNSQVMLCGADGEEIFTITFQPQFVAPDMGKSVDELERIFILPMLKGQRSILIITPQGEAHYELP